MATLPKVQVFVEDKSYAEPVFSGDRAVYIPFFSEFGPDNVIEEVQGPQILSKKYGKPNFSKFGFGLDFAMEASRYTSKLYVARLLPNDAQYAHATLTVVEKPLSSGDDEVQSNVNNSTTISVTSNFASQAEVGDYVYFNNDLDKVYQIVSVNTTDSTIEIDTPVTLSAGDKIVLVSKLSQDSSSVYNTESDIEGATVSGKDIVFYPSGRGKWYNDIKVVLRRNKTLDSMYTDDNGNPLYPYLFFDVYVYHINKNGAKTLLEDPITVSLLPTLPDGTVVKHPVSGRELYIETRLNEDSEFIRVKTSPDFTVIVENVNTRKAFDIYGIDGLQLVNGSDGSLFTSTGRLNQTVADQLLAQAYDGTLNEEFAKLLDTTFNYYKIDYIPDPGYSPSVKAKMVSLADIRQDALAILSTPYASKYTQDIDARQNLMTYNTWNAIIYTQYRTRFDQYTGKNGAYPASYHAMIAHLRTDAIYGIAEPVAKYKATVDEPIKLSYSPLASQAEELINYQLNPTTNAPGEPVMIETQFTTYKRLSVLQRAHVVKVIHKFRKEIPTLLKDLLQRKATNAVIDQAKSRVSHYLAQWTEGSAVSDRQTALKSFSVNVTFDEVISTLNVLISLKPIRAVELINIYISVE